MATGHRYQVPAWLFMSARATTRGWFLFEPSSTATSLSEQSKAGKYGTVFTVRITVIGEPKDALEALQEFLDPAEIVFTYTTETYLSTDGEEIDTAELMR